MLKLIFTLVLVVNYGILSGQDIEFEISTASDGGGINFHKNLSTETFKSPVPSLHIKCKSAGSQKTFTLVANGKSCSDFKCDNGKELKCSDLSDLRDIKLEIRESGRKLTEFTLLSSREFDVKVSASTPVVEFTDNVSVNEYAVEINDFIIKKKSPKNTGESYSININGKPTGKKFTDDGTEFKYTSTEDLRGANIAIVDSKTEHTYLDFMFKKKEGTGEEGGGNGGDGGDGGAVSGKFPATSAIQEIQKDYPSLVATQFGLQVPNGNRKTSYSGRKYVHIFLDQFGNNIFSTIPQGISNRQYVVHIYYFQPKNDPNTISYSLNQTAGEFQDALVFNNAGQAGMSLFAKEDIHYEWATKEFLLRTSTTNIQFDVIRTFIKSQSAQKYEYETQTLKSYTIAMSKVYHGSFDIGLINTTLKNPTYEFVASPTNSSEKVVKEVEGSNRGVVTVMATFYTSPVVLIESLFKGKEIPNYKLTGRNFLEDHKIYERIFPAIGVGFTDKTLENLFFGFNWEFARGGAIFVGAHYGKVNVFNAPAGFEFEKSPITEDQFNLYKNNEWKVDFAFGINVDMLIIRNLFRTP
ncbi:hypothetical protein [Flavihumibacter solisilvae]|uniref:Uncharacterized protein n=1 Tax=Flavihumibacter solisilvae TaxID=1349421 RepID=A0A0C1L7J0_9BACT|nr:hypothetical protein [Flavihumibacter solisilvae]KIC95491.1 hypothetical protein OI18_06335 [Flavihumibacter solisilvae]